MQMKSKLREHRKVTIGGFEKTLTEQNHKERVQIQNILHKFTKTGMLTHVNRLEGKYGDFPTHIEFHAMQNIIAKAQSMFESIPAQIRAKFQNDPAVFLEAVHDPANRDELIELGFHPDDLPDQIEPAAGPVPEPAPDPPAQATEHEPGPV